MSFFVILDCALFLLQKFRQSAPAPLFSFEGKKRTRWTMPLLAASTSPGQKYRGGHSSLSQPLVKWGLPSAASSPSAAAPAAGSTALASSPIFAAPSAAPPPPAGPALALPRRGPFRVLTRAETKPFAQGQ
jgi:hypothetical protein